MTNFIDAAMTGLDPITLIIALAIGLLAGFVKGAVGFAMPMILISGLGSILSAELALAALILPALVTNVMQALRQGAGAAAASARRFWLFLSVCGLFLLGSAQLVRVLSTEALFLLIGLPIVGFAVLQLAGWHLRLTASQRRPAELIMGAMAGFIGGLSGVWGPPTVAYLTAIDTPKQEQIRVQGVVYGVGAVLLALAHLRTGVLNAQTLPLSVLMLVPALGGMVIGQMLQDRLDQKKFRKITLLVLAVAGLNLIRRSLMG
ncbi:MAG: sulfite exporter TauE/SafE family protein [Celeribacter sp.]